MLIVFLLRTILSETIKLSGASRRHVALHPAAISTRARSFHREYANNVAFERDAGFRIADTGYRDLHLVDEVANQFPQIGRLLCIARRRLQNYAFAYTRSYASYEETHLPISG